MGKNFNGTLINGSQTITEKAGAEIADCRNRIVKYDSNGDVVLATAGTGDDVDIQVKDIGYVIAGAAIKKGQEITSGADGLAAVAAAGNYILGIALSDASANGYVRIQISKYQKADGVGAGVGA